MRLTDSLSSKGIKILLITISIVLFVLNTSPIFNAFAISACSVKTHLCAAPARNPIANEPYIPTPPTSILSSSGPTTGGAAISGAATGGAATGGAGSTGSPICYQGATCNFYGGQATSGTATGGSASGR